MDVPPRVFARASDTSLLVYVPIFNKTNMSPPEPSLGFCDLPAEIKYNIIAFVSHPNAF